MTHRSEMTHTFVIPQGAIRACPYNIIHPAHYLPGTGKCRCDDRSHTEMKKWGYVWVAGRWTAKP